MRVSISRKRRLVGLFGAVITIAAISTQAHAALIDFAGALGKPDISWNGAGVATYTNSSDLFTVTGNATQITLPGGGIESISVVTFPNLILGMTVNNAGLLTGGVTGNDLTISGSSSSFTGPTLVTAEAIAFGFATTGSADTWKAFDALFTVNGGSMFASGTTIGMTMILEGLTFPVGGFDFDSNFCYGAGSCPGNTLKGDVAPVPEPATLLLLGSGLASMGWFGRKRLKNDDAPKA